MSTNKRRKVDGQDGPQAGMSAMSAIAARRRLAGGDAGESASPETPKGSPIGSHNAYSVLQGLSRQGNSPSQAAAAASASPSAVVRTPRSSAAKRAGGEQKDASLAGEQNPGNVQFSSFRPTKHNHKVRPDDVTELRFEESERFLVYGSFGICVLEGEVTVAGASLRPDGKTHWVHAPLCHSLPVLRNREGTRLELHAHSDAVALRQLGRMSPLYRKMWNESGKGKTFQMLFSSEDVPKTSMAQELVSPAAWNKKLSSLTGDAATKAFSVLVCGPKSSGKSTFSKILVNRLVTGRAASRGVAVLDLDPGQPEYAPPGTLALVHVTEPNLTPAFTHIPSHSSFYRLKRCHSLASVSPASDMECCLSIALSLYAEYRKTLFQENVPLVVNTPGWVLGAGLELLDEVISAMTPNEVIYMSEEGPAETVDALEASVKGTSGTTLSTLPSQPAEFTARTGAHLRAMHTMSYFHSTSSGWDTTPVAAMAPWAVSYSGIKRDIRGVLFYDFQPMPSMVARAINGMVLALVEIEDARAYRNIDLGTSTSTTGTTSPEGIPLLRSPTGTTLDPAYSRTVGLVLVREIDKARKQLHLSTPIPVEEVRGISKRGRDLVLVHGNFDVPSWSYTEDLHQRADDVASGTKTLDVEEQNENTSDDDSDMEPQNAKEASDVAAVSWVEVRKGNEKRPVGSKKWRVRRDLGRYD